jgi:transcriptional regulator with XRE-family HTH domain
MFPIAKFLDRAKVNGKIKSDYQLAQVIGITQSAISQYRMGGTLPDERVITKLCTLSGDDAGVILAQIQVERVKTEEGKLLWRSIAARLQATAAVVMMAICGAMLFGAEEVNAEGAPAYSLDLTGSSLYIMSNAIAVMLMLYTLYRRHRKCTFSRMV